MWFKKFLCCNLLILGIRLLCTQYNGMELFADEAQYWLWSTAPDYGYYSKPPMIAWTIWLTTRLGVSEFFVRLASPILYSLTSMVVYLIGARIARNPQVAFWSGLAFLTMPGITLGGMLITTDSLLLLFWALTLYVLLNAGSVPLHWLIIGIFAGCGMLSKSSMLLFLPIALWWLWQQRHRIPYARSGVIWTLIAAFAVYAPNVYWNMANKMATVQHVATLVLGDFGWGNMHKGLLFLLAQFGIAGPIMFPYGVYLMWRQKWAIGKHNELPLLAALALVPIMLTAVIGLFSKAYGNWAAPAYIAFIVLTAVLSKQEGNHMAIWFRRAVVLNIVLSMLVISSPFAVHLLAASGIDLGKYNPLQRIQGSQELTERIVHHYEAYNRATGGQPILVSDDRKELALLAYYGRDEYDHPLYVAKWNPQHKMRDHFDLSIDLNGFCTQDLFLVSRSLNLEELRKYAPQAQIYDIVHIRYNGKERDYILYVIRDFGGY